MSKWFNFMAYLCRFLYYIMMYAVILTHLRKYKYWKKLTNPEVHRSKVTLQSPINKEPKVGNEEFIICDGNFQKYSLKFSTLNMNVRRRKIINLLPFCDRRPDISVEPTNLVRFSIVFGYHNVLSEIGGYPRYPQYCGYPQYDSHQNRYKTSTITNH